MAYNDKYVSVEQVIEKAFRDSGLTDIDWESAIEWTAELLGLLGLPCTKIDKVTNGQGGWPDPIIVEGYRFRLPEDMVSLTSVRRAYLDTEGNIVGYDPMMESMDVFQTEVPMNTGGATSFDPIFNTVVPGEDDQGDFELKEVTVHGSTPKPDNHDYFRYKLDVDTAFTDFEDGYVEVAYKGLPIDDRGLPLVPDDPKFLNALKYHIIFKCDWKNWRKNPASPGLRAVVNDSEQRRDFYVGAAITKARIPSLDKMEALKRQWLRTIPKINEHGNGFNTLSRQEHRYNILSIPNNGR